MRDTILGVLGVFAGCLFVMAAFTLFVIAFGVWATWVADVIVSIVR